MKIQLFEYDPAWVKLFEAEKKLIETAFPLKDVLIEHIGSTAVPDLIAKPVIDIMIGLSALPEDISAIFKHLQSLGYDYIEEYNSIIPERRFFTKELNGKRTHHLHMVSFKSSFWDRHLFFRNKLREDSSLRKQYQDLKKDLAQKEWDSSNDYANAKNDFIKAIDSLRINIPPFYHGTKADLKPGDLIVPGFNSNYGRQKKAHYIYLSATLDAATWGAELAQGEGKGRIYIVEPTGTIEDDPNLTDKKFPGNPTKSYRSKEPLRVIGEIKDWKGHSPEQLKAMKDNLDRLKQMGIEAIED